MEHWGHRVGLFRITLVGFRNIWLDSDIQFFSICSSLRTTFCVSCEGNFTTDGLVSRYVTLIQALPSDLILKGSISLRKIHVQFYVSQCTCDCPIRALNSPSTMCHRKVDCTRHICGHEQPVSDSRVDCQSSRCRYSHRHPQPCGGCPTSCHQMLERAETVVTQMASTRCYHCSRGH